HFEIARALDSAAPLPVAIRAGECTGVELVDGRGFDAERAIVEALLPPSRHQETLAGHQLRRQQYIGILANTDEIRHPRAHTQLLLVVDAGQLESGIALVARVGEGQPRKPGHRYAEDLEARLLEVDDL